MADAPALGAGVRKDMEVQVLSPAPSKIFGEYIHISFHDRRRSRVRLFPMSEELFLL